MKVLENVKGILQIVKVAVKKVFFISLLEAFCQKFRVSLLLLLLSES